MVAVAPVFCPNCGDRVTPGADFCPRCYQPLPRTPTEGASPPISSDPLASWPLPRGPLGLVLLQGGRSGRLWLAFSIVLIVFGVGLLVGSSFVHVEAATLGHDCSLNSPCFPASELSVIFGIVGAACLLLGIIGFTYALKRGLARSSFATLPP